MKAQEILLAITGVAIAIVVAIIVIPALSGRVDLSVSYAASADTLKVQNRTLLEKWKNESIIVNDIQGLSKLGDYIIDAKDHAGDNYGGGTRTFTLNGFEYYSLNSKLSGTLDDGGTMIVYDNDFYIILARKY